MCEGQARLFPGIILNIKKDAWLTHVHTQCSTEMCLVNMNAAVSNELSGRQDAQPCSEAEHRPCLGTSSGIKAGIQMVSCCLP